MYFWSFFTSFFKKDVSSNEKDYYLPRDCWLTILNFLKKDEEINILRLVSTEMQLVTTLTEAGKNYYQRKEIFFNNYNRIRTISQTNNNYARFFESQLKKQVTSIRAQLTANHAKKFTLVTYYDNSFHTNEEIGYLSQHIGDRSFNYLSLVCSNSWRNRPHEYYYYKRHGHDYVDNIIKFSKPLSGKISVLLIFTIDATKTNQFIKLLEENNSPHLPFIIVVSLSPHIKIEDFDFPVLKLLTILPSYWESIRESFSLNYWSSDLWTKTSHQYNSYYHDRVKNLYEEIDNVLENLINIKEFLDSNEVKKVSSIN